MLLFTPKFLALYLFLGSAVYVHLRGRVRFRFTRQLFNHSTLLAPYNALMYLFSAVPAKPVLDPTGFPELAPLAAHWTTIRGEARRLFDEGYIREALAHNDVGFNSFFKRGWKRFYLKWYGDPLPSAAKLCPRTVALLEEIPTVKAAMFAVLEPGAKLNPHRDPFAGSLRYHLGLVTPNSDACFIEVDGERLVWRDGVPIMFDETFIHWAQNKTELARVILFCDVERPLRTSLLRGLNRWVSRNVVKASATQNVPAEPVGAINGLYGNVVHPVLSSVNGAFARLKQRNRTAARLVKYTLVIALAALFLAWAM
jgi:beta-hydroxylase